jgi:predicted alpha/beta hydrolase family esterase
MTAHSTLFDTARARALPRVPVSPARQTPRLLVVPGLHDSGPAHWQSWLQAQLRDSVRVVQDDWSTPDLARWADRIESTLQAAGPGPWLVAAHSFGVLALAHLMGRRMAAQAAGDEPMPLGLKGALLVAPADPVKFGVGDRLPQEALPLTTTLVASDSDPWMIAGQARHWAGVWGSGHLNLGDAGHINAESGFGPLPLARRWWLAMQQRLARQQRPGLA